MPVNVSFQVFIPIDLASRLREKVGQLRALHDLDLAQAEKRGRVTGSKKAFADQRALLERGRRITVPHLLRACIVKGRAILEVKPEDLLTLLARDPVVRGRPRNGAQK